MKNAVIESYYSFNQRRYGNPWVALVDSRGKVDFSERIGAYTGRYGSGEAGDLYVFEPVEGEVYAYGQKDHRGGNSIRKYVQYIDGHFVPVENLLEAIKQRDLNK